MGQLMVPENLMLIGFFLLVLIIVLLFVLIGSVGKLTRLLSGFTPAQPSAMNQYAPGVSEVISEEEVAVITAVIAKMLPGVKTGAIHISPVSK